MVTQCGHIDYYYHLLQLIQGGILGFYHCHLGSNQMLKNVGILNQKIGNVKNDKASHCKNENV